MKKEKFLIGVASVLAFVACSSNGGVNDPNVGEGSTEESNAIAVLWDSAATRNVWQDLSDGNVKLDVCDGLCGTVGLALPDDSAAGQGYAGVALNVTRNGETADLSEKDGLCVTYSSDMDMEVVLDLGETENAAIDNDLPAAKFGKTGEAAESRCAKWSDFKQKRINAISGVAAAKRVSALRFMFYGDLGTSGSFNVKKVSAVTNSEIPLSSSSEVSSSSSERIAEKDTVQHEDISGESFLWDYTDTEGRVITGFDEDGLSGYWYDFASSDVSYDTKSVVTYPPDVFEDENGNFFGPLTKANGGLKGNAVIDESDSNPYVGLGFNVVNENQDGADVTNWGGICLTYSSTVPIRVALGVEATITESTYFYGTAAASDSVVSLDLPWNKFLNSGGWGYYDYDINDALKVVAAVKLMIQESGDFLIKEIGSLGQCGKPRK